MEEQFQGQEKEAMQKHRGGKDGITNSRCQTFINQNLHCIVPTIKTKQQQKCRTRNVERETHLGSLEEEDKGQNINNLPHPPPPPPQYKCLAFLSGLKQAVRCLSIGRSRITAGVW